MTKTSNPDLPERHGADFGAEEQQKLYFAYINGEGIEACAAEHQRSVNSISIMLKNLGLIDDGGVDLRPWAEFKPYKREQRREKQEGGSLSKEPNVKIIEEAVMPSIASDKPELQRQPILTNTFAEDVDFLNSLIDASNFDDRLKRILVARLGLNSDQSILTLQGLAEEFGVSRERVRQVEHRGLRRFRGLIRKNYLPHPRYNDILGSLDADKFQNMVEQTCEETGSYLPVVLSKFLFLFDLSVKNAKEAEDRCSSLARSYRTQLKRQLREEKANSLRPREARVAQSFLMAITEPMGCAPVDVSGWLYEPRKVQDTENSGLFFSKKSSKGIQFESGAELSIFRMLEKMREINWYDVQRLRFDYKLKDKSYTYHPDIVCTLQNGRVAVIEVKPAVVMPFLMPFRKAMVAKDACDANGWYYVMLCPSRGTIGDVVKIPVSSEAEQDFLNAIGNKRITEREGIDWQQIKALKTKHGLGWQELAAMAIKNDLAFDEKPFTLGRLPTGLSWRRVMSPSDGFLLSKEGVRPILASVARLELTKA